MKILVIGSGFLGAPIIQSLEADGHELLIFTRQPKPNLRAKQISGNILDFSDFEKTLEWNPNVIIHTAWITTPGLYVNDPLNIEYRLFSTKLAQRIASSNLAHLIVLGSCSEYGTQNLPALAGSSLIAPESEYARQKVEAFGDIKRILADTGIRFTWARVYFPYGIGQHPDRLIPYLTRSLLSGDPIQLKNPTSVSDWITSRDIGSAISWLINNVLPVEVDIGTGRGISNLDLLSKLAKILEVKVIPMDGPADYFQQFDYKVVDKNSPIFKSGWSPQDDLESGLQWVINT
jgi:nucleoside-diphosphate-sugar epimerase